MFSQDSFEWDDHNEAMDDINWNDSIRGWYMLFVIIGIFYLIHKFIINIKKNNVNLNNSVENLPKTDFLITLLNNL